MTRQQCTKPWCEGVPYHGCRDSHDEHAHFTCGRCKSGKRWFWSVCKWPSVGDDLNEWPKWYGWTDTVEAAKQAAYGKIKEIAGYRPVSLHTQHHLASSTLREVSQQKRKERMAANPSNAMGVASAKTAASP
jgi:hypothetical protein